MEYKQLPKEKIENTPKTICYQAHVTEFKDTHPVEVVLWEEIFNDPSRFNRDAIKESINPTVIAVTAIKVKDHQTTQKIWSTRTTFVYLNPICAETEILIDNFNKEETKHKEYGHEQINRNKAITIITENITAVASLTQKEDQELKGKYFALIGAITEITTNEWCQTTCPRCGKQTYQTDKQWFCTTDGIQTKANHTFRISATISDETGSIPSNAIRGKNATFHTQVQKDSSSGKVRCTVNKVSEVSIDTEKDLQLNIETTPPPTPQAAAPTSKNQKVTKQAQPRNQNKHHEKNPNFGFRLLFCNHVLKI